MTTNTVALSFPVTVAGKEITEAVFRRPKGRDMRLLARLQELEPGEGKPPSPEAQSEATALIIRAVTGWGPEVVDEVDLLEDIPRLAEAAADFLERITPPAQASGGQ